MPGEVARVENGKRLSQLQLLVISERDETGRVVHQTVDYDAPERGVGLFLCYVVCDVPCNGTG